MPAETPSNHPAPDWNGIAARPAFRSLIESKKRFLVSASVFFVIYYFALLVLVGWFPDLMKKEVFGKVNLAYVFALSQFFMAWIVAFFYVKKAAQWDREAADVISK